MSLKVVPLKKTLPVARYANNKKKRKKKQKLIATSEKNKSIKPHKSLA